MEVETVESDSDDGVGDDASATASVNYAGFSREELIEMLKKTKVSSKPIGSAPKSGNRSHSQTSDKEEIMSEDGSFSGSSSGSSAGLSDEGSDGTPSG